MNWTRKIVKRHYTLDDSGECNNTLYLTDFFPSGNQTWSPNIEDAKLMKDAGSFVSYIGEAEGHTRGPDFKYTQTVETVSLTTDN